MRLPVLDSGAYAEYICMAVGTKPKDGMVELKPANMTYEQAAVIPAGGLGAQVFTRNADIRRGQEVLIYGRLGERRQLRGTACKVYGSGNDRRMQYCVFDAVGKLRFSQRKKALKKDGRFLSVMDSAELEADDLFRLKELVEAGAIKPYIDRTYTLEQIVEAHRYAEQGRKKANVVIKVRGTSEK